MFHRGEPTDFRLTAIFAGLPARAEVSPVLDGRRQKRETGRGKMELALSHLGGKGDRNRTVGSLSAKRRTNEPGWAQGLRKLYNSVLDEPIPDSFDDLLKKLDRSGDDKR